jgi:hypothetical protein
MTNFKNPNPDCERDHCQFICGGGTSTLVYYIPTYDKNGVNINPDRNTTTFTVECIVCNTKWRGATQLGETTYEEVK